MKTAQSYWLMKSEPEVFSLSDLKNRPKMTEPWNGVRNYQARNFMRDRMRVGDAVLFYHSSCKVPAIMGLAEVASPAYPDPTARDPKSPYYDKKSTPENPIWFVVDIVFRKEFASPVTLAQLRTVKGLEKMQVLQKGNRLSITPVTPQEFRIILSLDKGHKRPTLL